MLTGGGRPSPPSWDWGRRCPCQVVRSQVQNRSVNVKTSCKWAVGNGSRSLQAANLHKHIVVLPASGI